MAARTLLQQAAADDVRVQGCGLARRAARGAKQPRSRSDASGSPSQLGGAVGTLAAIGERRAWRSCGLLADDLGLAEPVLPWHTNRTRIAELGAALATTAGVLAKIGLDIVLLAQTEVGEVREGAGGGSSTLPHKRNPISATLARACARLVSGYASVLSASLAQEHERAAGAWHAEWEALSGALAYTGGAAHAIAHGDRLARDRRRADARATSTRPTASSSPNA